MLYGKLILRWEIRVLRGGVDKGKDLGASIVWGNGRGRKGKGFSILWLWGVLIIWKGSRGRRHVELVILGVKERGRGWRIRRSRCRIWRRWILWLWVCWVYR